MNWSPPILPVPCSPINLTPPMQATFPLAMQEEFCALYGLYASPFPMGVGLDPQSAFWRAMDDLCWIRNWCRLPDGAYARENADGSIQKAGKVLSARNVAAVRASIAAAKASTAALEALLVAAGEETEEGEREEPGADVGKQSKPGETFGKADTARRTLAGWASVFKTADGPVVDLDGDIIDGENLTDVVHPFVAEGGIGRIAHKGLPLDSPEVLAATAAREEAHAVYRKALGAHTEIVEAVIVTPDFRAALAANPDYEGLYVKHRYLTTPEGNTEWAAVAKAAREGKRIPMQSIGGLGGREE